ncbi:hypothetical protein ABZX40_15115 [Streptomyces sp. NPDC004610]|uniref:hypothetical protein n=1 Tax=unclassified Streptomyces TaxID=2593676 RepID=UPI0033B3B8E6
MVDTHSRGYESVARWLFYAGPALFLLGLVVGWSVKRHRDNAWICRETCEPGMSPAWQAIEIVTLVILVLGPVLASTGLLMATLRKPKARPPRSNGE